MRPLESLYMYMRQVKLEVICIITFGIGVVEQFSVTKLHQMLHSHLAIEQALTDYYDRIGVAPSSTVGDQDVRH